MSVNYHNLVLGFRGKTRTKTRAPHHQAFKKNPCRNLRVLWLQRLDLWDDLESLASALGPAHCPVLEELFLDLALDTDDVARLAACLHR